MSKVWFVTGAGSGIGAATAEAALNAGDRVVATGRNVDKVRNAIGSGAGNNLEILPWTFPTKRRHAPPPIEP
jgi:NAD(P)-dependent dehydrogenase (short-subunit alcohol dehydrogenase family)